MFCLGHNTEEMVAHRVFSIFIYDPLLCYTYKGEEKWKDQAGTGTVGKKGKCLYTVIRSFCYDLDKTSDAGK